MELYCAGTTKALQYACEYLRNAGCIIAQTPGAKTTHLLTDVPLRRMDLLESILGELPESATICGGRLDIPGRKSIDFLKDPFYLAQNAYITAECALDAALPCLTVTLRGCPVLITGWGRIGKCLADLLKAIGSDVTIAARKEEDRAMIHALGLRAVDYPSLAPLMGQFRLIYNTVPEMVLTGKMLENCRSDCVKIELASKAGMPEDDVIIARGLPGIHLPESSGKLIAETFLRLCRKEAAP